MNKLKNFLSYLKETVDLNPIIGKDEQILPFKQKDKKLFKNVSLKDSDRENDRILDDYKSLKGRKDKYLRDKIKERNRLYKNIKNYEDIEKNKTEFLMRPLTIIKNDKEWRKSIRDLEFIDSEIKNLSSARDTYSNSLRMVLKKFFSIGGKIPKRYIFLPLSSSNMISLSEIEKLNNENKHGLFKYLKEGKYAVNEDGQEVIDYLNNHGYECDKNSFLKNKCKNENGKMIDIDMELNRIQDININTKTNFINKLKSKDTLNEQEKRILLSAESDLTKKNNFKDYYLYLVLDQKEKKELFLNHVIVLTWVPRLIMSQSTNTIWSSCMRYFGMSSSNKGEEDEDDEGVNVHYVLPGIKQGTFVAWLIKLDDTKVKKPMARALIKPYFDQQGNIFFWPSTVYTTGGQKSMIQLFSKTLKMYALQKQKNLFTQERINDLRILPGTYHDTFDLKPNSTISTNIPKDFEDKKIDYKSLLKSPNITDEDISKILEGKEIIRNLMQSNEPYWNFIYLLDYFVKNKKYYLINKYFDIYIKNRSQDALESLLLSYLETASSNFYKEKNMMNFLLKKISPTNKEKISNYSRFSLDKDIMYFDPNDKIDKFSFLTNYFGVDFFKGIKDYHLAPMMLTLDDSALKIFLKSPHTKNIKIDINDLQEINNTTLHKIFHLNQKAFYLLVENFLTVDRDDADFLMSQKNIFFQLVQDKDFNGLKRFIENKFFSLTEEFLIEIGFDLDWYLDIIISFKDKNQEVFDLLKNKNIDFIKIAIDEYSNDFDYMTKNYYTFQKFCEAYSNKHVHMVIFLNNLLKNMREKNLEQVLANLSFDNLILSIEKINVDFFETIIKEIAKAGLRPRFLKHLNTIFFEKDVTIEKEKTVRKILDHYFFIEKIWEKVKKAFHADGEYDFYVNNLIIVYLYPDLFKKYIGNLNINLLVSKIEFFSKENKKRILKIIVDNKIMINLKKISLINELAFYMGNEGQQIDDYIYFLNYFIKNNLIRKEEIKRNIHYLKYLVLKNVKSIYDFDYLLKAIEENNRSIERLIEKEHGNIANIFLFLSTSHMETENILKAKLNYISKFFNEKEQSQIISLMIQKFLYNFYNINKEKEKINKVFSILKEFKMDKLIDIKKIINEEEVLSLLISQIFIENEIKKEEVEKLLNSFDFENYFKKAKDHSENYSMKTFDGVALIDKNYIFVYNILNEKKKKEFVENVNNNKDISFVSGVMSYGDFPRLIKK